MDAHDDLACISRRSARSEPALVLVQETQVLTPPLQFFFTQPPPGFCSPEEKGTLACSRSSFLVKRIDLPTFQRVFPLVHTFFQHIDDQIHNCFLYLCARSSDVIHEHSVISRCRVTSFIASLISLMIEFFAFWKTPRAYSVSFADCLHMVYWLGLETLIGYLLKVML